MPLFLINRHPSANIMFSNGTKEVKCRDAIIIHPDIAKQPDIFEAIQREWVEVVEAESKESLTMPEQKPPLNIVNPISISKMPVESEAETAPAKQRAVKK